MDKSLFSKTLFWDADVAALDAEKSRFYVIERVVTRGSLADWKKMLSIFSLEEIKLNVLKISSLDAKTLNFCSLYFKLPKEEFKCYLKPSWTEVH